VQEFGLTDPAKILDKVRELVLATFESTDTEVRDGMDISIFALNFSSKKLKWAGANNPIWYKKVNEKTISEIKADKQPIGRYAAEKPFTSHEMQMEKGDIIYLFTDGYPDQFGGAADSKASGKKLKTVNMKKLVNSICSKNLEEQGEYLAQSFEKWKGDLEQLDDVCVAGIKI
jgi:serine phosphatase RsbU (regulator of sigma subunit)